VPAADRDQTRLAPQIARLVVITVFTGFCVVAALIGIGAHPHLGYAISFISVLAALLLIQLLYFTREGVELRSWHGRAMLAFQAALVYLPFLAFGQAWAGMPGFLAGNALLVLSAPLGWTVVGLVTVSIAVLQAHFTGRAQDIAYATVSTIITSMIVYGMSRLASLVAELQAARLELARMAVAQERLRFARDLHDLLGYSLSAVTLKSELARRLVGNHPAGARDELAEILEISRQALADVRAVASGYRDMSLDSEARSVRSVLAAADIAVTMRMSYEPLPDSVSTVLATVLREGVTNVLRHSKAETCDIVVVQDGGTVRMRIENDGVQPEPVEPTTRQGSGIQNLSSRVSALRGRLTAGILPDGRFHLCADLPISVAVPAPSSEPAG